MSGPPSLPFGTPAGRTPTREVVTVSELTNRIRGVLESTQGEVWVEGEIANSRLWKTGHLYFTLRDEHAQLKASRSAESFRKQVESLRNALEIEPTNFETAGMLGEIHRRRAMESSRAARKVELKKAAFWLKEAITLNRYDAYSHARLGMALDELGQADKAGKYFAEAEKLDPNGYLTVANVGWHKMHIGEYAEAKSYFDRVSPLDDPNTPEDEREKGLVAHRAEQTAQDLARHIRESYMPYIAEQLRDSE